MLKSSSHPVFFLQFTCWSSILAMCAQQYYYLLLHLTVTWREKPASHTGNSNNKASKTPIFTPAIRDFTYHRSFFIESTLIKPYRLGFSVQFSHLVMSDSLWPHELQHIRPPCPSPTPGVHPTPCPLSRWCHPTISSSVIPFSCLQSFPASGSFQMSQVFASGGPKYWNFSFNISPSNGYSGLISFRIGLRVPWTARRSNQSILKEISPGCSFEGLMLKLKLQYFGLLMQRIDSSE